MMFQFQSCALVLFCYYAHVSFATVLGVVSHSNNDLWVAIEDTYTSSVIAQDIRRYDSIDSALSALPSQSALLVLSTFVDPSAFQENVQGYPMHATPISQQHYVQMQTKSINAYIEYPAELPGSTASYSIQKYSELLRYVNVDKTNTVLRHGLKFLDIFTPMHAYYLAFKDDRSMSSNTIPLLVSARVAGYDSAVFGLPKTVYPLLYQTGSFLIARSGLSHVRQQRLAPYNFFQQMWQSLMEHLLQCSSYVKTDSSPLCQVIQKTPLSWKQVVTPRFNATEAIPANYERITFKDSADWLVKNSFTIRFNASTTECPAPYFPSNNHSAENVCLWEGFSDILVNGSQLLGKGIRTDNSGEVTLSMALAALTNINNDLSVEKEQFVRAVTGIFNYLFEYSAAQKGPRADPSDASYGNILWTTNPPVSDSHYSDNDARALMGLLGARGVLKRMHNKQVNQWNDALSKLLLANLRLTNEKGFQPNSVRLSDVSKNGWEHYHQSDNVISTCSHYQSYIWAPYFLAYNISGISLFKERALAGCQSMFAMPMSQWQWTQTWDDQLAHMILPLAWLVRVDDTPKHRDWLRNVTQALLKFQQPNGGIQDFLGDEKHRISAGPPESNAAYHGGEAPLLQENGDPVTDALYTLEFAFIGLHEAYAATGESLYKEGEEKLADYLVRTQTTSQSPYETLTGSWMRAFDYRRWDFYASNSGIGWGPWAYETGWTHAWISGTFGLRQMEISLWELSRGDRQLQSQMAESLRKEYAVFFPVN